MRWHDTLLRALPSALLVALLLMGSPAPSHPGSPAPQASRPPRTLWVMNHQRWSPAERMLAVTLQGLANRRQPRVWLRAGGMSAVVLEELQKEGTQLREAASVWELIGALKGEIRGAIVYRLGTPSVSVATSLCGPMQGVAVEESLLERAQSAGLKVIFDTRGMDERQMLREHRARFRSGIAVEQATEKVGHLRDFAVARNAFTFSTTDPAFRTEAARAVGPDALIFGWGDDEFRWVRDISRANATGVPADWSLNLSALQHLSAGKLQRPRRPRPTTEEGVRYIAFVMSDGDNIQWLGGNFVHDRGFWGSPLRGQFPMTWEVAPPLAEVAPRILRHFYRTATDRDGFVTGPGAPGYTFPHHQPDRRSLARQAAGYLRRSDLSVVSVLNDNAGRMEDTIPLLELPEVEGVIYKDYAPYHRRKGAILWHNGKPCVAYRFLLWEGIQSPEQMAQEAAKMPASPKTDPGSYALVNVHAWSFRDIGGPMEAVRRAIALLPPDTRVITADDLIYLLRENFGKRAGSSSR